ncbi:MAG: 3-isopropylmalate dehydratase large subunit [Burkholderiaceae bacterium]|jgi:3-isopropylmalate/(R)-2-methylmalate dehydratase large subunit|nr:3-isopropylmalate dehydratase [Betaproteobacteria bacterium]
MGFTITEKILARVAQRPAVRAGDEVLARPDFVIAYDFPGYTDVIFKQMKDDFGIDRVTDPKRFALFIDHMVPVATPKEEELHIQTRQWGAQQGVPVYERKGIGHQVSAELGYATPGAFAVHFDGHISQLGALGTLAIGLRRNLLEAFVNETVSLRVPATVRVNLHGKLRHGVMARDVFHHIVRVMGPASCAFKVLELGGPVIDAMSIEGRQTLCGQAMFVGATTAIVNPDQKAIDYARNRARIALDPVTSDIDAVYERVVEIDISALEPIVVIPPSPARTRDLTDFIGLPIHAGYLGSCASGRMEDLRAAAQVLRGRQVAAGVSLHIVPTSQAIMSEAAAEGLIQVFSDAGAFVSSPSCDYCFGRIGTMTAGQRAVSTGTLNVPGRMGSPDSEIYICNAAVVAASAVAGSIADPRPLLAATAA